MSKEAWEPLEGTPEAFNVLAKELGLDTRRWHFVDVLGLDDDLLSLTAHQGAAALIFLYPTTDKEIDLYLKRNDTASLNVSRDVHFRRQLVGGTCGTIAVFHAIANSTQCRDGISPESLLNELLKETVEDNNDDAVMNRSRRFAESARVQKAHDAAVATGFCDGISTRPAAGQRQGRHFITFVNSHDILLELDGRRSKPVVCRTTTSAATFLKDAAAEVKAIVATTQDSSIHIRCSLVALVPIIHL